MCEIFSGADRRIVVLYVLDPVILAECVANLRHQMLANVVSNTQHVGTYRFQLPSKLVAVGWKGGAEKNDVHLNMYCRLLSAVICGG